MRAKKSSAGRRQAAEGLRSDLVVLSKSDVQAEDEAWDAFCRTDPCALPVPVEVRTEAPAPSVIPATVLSEAPSVAAASASSFGPALVGPPPPPPAPGSYLRLPPAVEAARPPRPVGGDAREAAVLFRRSAVAAAGKGPNDPDSRADARQCAMALLQLAGLAEEELLASHLRPDPARSACTWTVACYQIGDLSPTSLRDFPEAVEAVLHLADCETRSHVAAELIAATGDGLRWTALVRSGAEVRFQPFDAPTVTADTPDLISAARRNWDGQIFTWQADETADLVVAEPAASAPAGDQAEVNHAVGQILESVRRIEERLPADDTVARRITELEAAQREAAAELKALRAELARLTAPGNKQTRRGWRRAVAVGAALAAATTLTACGSTPKSKGLSLSVFHLRAGECATTPQAVKAQLSNIKVVSCREPHTQEVFALVDDNAGSTYPGTTVLQTFANGACLQRFAGYVGVDYRDSSLFYTYLLPSVRSWAQGDRTVDCVITTTGQQLTRSVKGARL